MKLPGRVNVVSVTVTDLARAGEFCGLTLRLGKPSLSTTARGTDRSIRRSRHDTARAIAAALMATDHRFNTKEDAIRALTGDDSGDSEG
jgi:hypothetical protein